MPSLSTVIATTVRKDSGRATGLDAGESARTPLARSISVTVELNVSTPICAVSKAT